MSSSRRQLTLLEAVFLVGATGTGMSFWRSSLENLLYAPKLERSLRFYWYNTVSFSCVLAVWSLALLALALIRFRRRRAHLVASPAFWVGSIVLLDAAIKGSAYVLAVGIHGRLDAWPLLGSRINLSIVVPMEVGLSVGATVLMQGIKLRRLFPRDSLGAMGLCVAILWMLLGWLSYLFRLTAA